MHDGQMLFDSSDSWNHKEWMTDETISTLIREQKIEECMVVGIWNSEHRQGEYLPRKPFDTLSPALQEAVYQSTNPGGQPFFNSKIVSDQYLMFMVSELKPFIDGRFSTLPDQANTYIAGSSMGGLISLYALCEYPEVFKGAACLSTHWTGTVTAANNPLPEAFLQYLNKRLPDPEDHLLYMDHGTLGLDAQYGAIQEKADQIIRAKGYTDANFLTRVFPGDDHVETAWARRLPIAVEFLLKP
jgi:enterochelin esterase-like enzyme